nr:5'-nucleotidase C-terminal domain-containing protein [Bacteroidota bacterium]
MILGPTSKARDVAVAGIKLSLNKVTNHYSKTVTGEIINMQDFETYPAFMANFDDVLEEGKEYVSKPLGYLTQTISSRDAFFGDASFTDLIHRIQLDLTDADISLTAPLSFDMTIEKGDMYVRDLFNLYRFENLLYTMELGGIEIKDFLEYSTNLWFNTMKSGKDHMINFAQDSAGNLMKSRYGNGHQLENAYYNFDTGEGINYTVDLSKTYGERVNIISMADGSPFDLNKKYTVAVNSYRGSGGGNHLIAGSRIRQELLKDRVTESSGKDFRYLIMKWIEQKEQVTPSVTDNWTLIPADWASSAAQRDRKLLFGNEEK